MMYKEVIGFKSHYNANKQWIEGLISCKLNAAPTAIIDVPLVHGILTPKR